MEISDHILYKVIELSYIMMLTKYSLHLKIMYSAS